ncbi:MAG: hypothetical protein ABS43_01625 [Bordetella sp. SCN 67-23]|nr:hypothetical protein [Burkholderiales bacterium]ODS76271.1 MAG: hypothetical protein ABS43_01625 [Bordetella sp. SCN 67-23]ODU76639.1 MAG: hypothetical protein ABT00_15065 [Bordetella sp. SCN 68-11]OJW90074.1 MAG: hypothetical protein BGO71_27560 [Burkholderiales bacterium 67-32]
MNPTPDSFGFALVIMASLSVGAAVGYFVCSIENARRFQRLEDSLYRYKAFIRSSREWLSEMPDFARFLDNLQAFGEGKQLNAGPPRANENCTLPGLCVQLREIRTGLRLRVDRNGERP